MQPILGPQQSIICNKPRNQFADQKKPRANLYTVTWFLAAPTKGSRSKRQLKTISHRRQIYHINRLSKDRSVFGEHLKSWEDQTHKSTC